MADAERLLVTWDQKLVGILARHIRGRATFQYSREWLNGRCRPVSLSLPCRPKRFPPGISTAFFENLLPENSARRTLAFNNRFDHKDTFAFLERFGEDCAGALSIIPDDAAPEFTPGRYQCVDREMADALDRINADPNRHYLFPEMKTARLSIAGAQDKLPVYMKEGRFYLPLTAGSPTTHIVKPASPEFPDLPRNEAFCMELARRLDLPVPDSRIMHLDGHELFVIDRYDREVTGNEVVRIHQEDFCQAMGIPANRKYQETGGPGLRDCRQLINEHLPDLRGAARLKLMQVTVFNYLIGNHDAHGKNFSILHRDGPSLAPFYDLLSTQVYPLDPKFAMAIGNTWRHDRIRRQSFELLAKALNFRFKKTETLIRDTLQAVDNHLPDLLSIHERQYGPSDIYPQLNQTISNNLDRLQQIIT